MAEYHIWADVMLRRSHVCASRASPAQKPQGLSVVCYKKISMATFFFLGHLVGGQLFELFARETNLKKQSSVGSRGRQAAGTMCSSLAHHSLCTVLLQGPNFHLEVCPSRAGFCCDLFQNKNHGF